MEFLIIILIVYGISSIVTIIRIFEPLRDLAEKLSPKFWSYLASCMQCLPFWIGIFVSIVLGSPTEVDNEKFPTYLNVFLPICFLLLYLADHLC